MKKLLTFLITLLVIPLSYGATQRVYIGDLYYNLDDSNNTAKVTYEKYYDKSNYQNLSGAISIPETVAYEGFKFTVISIEKYAFKDCSGLTSITIPNSVISIGDWAFDDCSGLTRVVISDLAAWCNIDFRGFNANPLTYAKHLYLNNTEITELIIPDGITLIGKYAFYNCSGLTSVTIPNSVTSIGYRAFRGCSGLTSVTIPNSVTSIGDEAFYDCSGLTSVTIPNSVSSIGQRAFYNCSGLTSVTIGNSVTSIGNEAFYGCSGLTSVTIPNSVTYIANNAFQGCSGLKKSAYPNNLANPFPYGLSISYPADDSFIEDCIVMSKEKEILYFIPSDLTGDFQIPNSVTSIGNQAFTYCSGLTNVTIPNSVTSIGERAFSGCSGLKSVTIPNSVTSIGNFAFYNCSGMTSVTLPNSVTSIGERAFSGCSGLTRVDISDLAAWCNIKFRNYEANPLYYAKHLYLNNEEIIDLIIPDDVTSIANYAFYYCNGLTSVTIPDSVTSIGDYAFRGCNGLTSVTIGNSATSIGEWAFSGCSGLTSVAIPNSVSSIGKSAFYGCSGLTSVSFPESLTQIGESAFENCDGINSIIFNSNQLLTINNMAFAGCDNLNFVICNTLLPPVSEYENVFDNSTYSEATLYVPSAQLDLYSTTSPWKYFSIIRTMNGMSNVEIQANGDTEMALGSTLQLYLTIPEIPGLILNSVTWNSSDKNVASVNDLGLVTAVSAGTAVITASDANGNTASLTVTVVNDYSNGVDSVISGSEKPSIFTINGLMLKREASQEEIDALAPGIYIIGGKKVIIR